MRQLTIFCITIAAVALTVSGAFAQADIGFKGAGLEVGMVNAENVDATWGIKAFADLGTITPRVALEAYTDYWTKTQDEFGFEASVRDIAFGARGKWMFPVSNPRIRPYAGAGLSMHFLRVKATTPDLNIGGTLIPGTTVSASDEKLGLDIGGGMTTTMNERTDFVAEMWYGIVSDFSQLSLKLGVLYKLGM
jgi:outer membrane protein W